MTQSQNTPPLNRRDVEKTELTEQEKNRAGAKKKLKFYGFVALMVIMCIVFIWFIFKPDNTKQEEGSGGINFSIPEASIQENEGDKRKALEKAEMQDKQRDRVRSMLDFEDNVQPIANVESDKAEPTPIQQSQQTAKRLNEQMMTFYQQPKEDPQIEALRKQVEQMSAMLQEQNSQQGTQPRQVNEMELLEKSFEMASKLMPNGQQTGIKEIPESKTAQKARDVEKVRRAGDNPVTSLMEFELTPQERNYGFVTSVGTEAVIVGNAIRACVNSDQVVTAGAQVKMRLLEPLRVGSHIVPVNSPVYGTARIEGHRIGIVITSIESAGNIIPVELTVHDMDGQAGLNVPNTMERTAAKEALASVGSGMGQSVSFTQNAGQQVAMDLTRGILSGGSQYLSAKMREVKISLKAGYQVLLIAKD